MKQTSERGSQAPLVIKGGTLIDATGRLPIIDSLIIIQGERITAVGQRNSTSVPDNSTVIDAQGKTILPGFIDGHGHYDDFAEKIYLHLGVTTCPDIQTTRYDY